MWALLIVALLSCFALFFFFFFHLSPTSRGPCLLLPCSLAYAGLAHAALILLLYSTCTALLLVSCRFFDGWPCSCPCCYLLAYLPYLPACLPYLPACLPYLPACLPYLPACLPYLPAWATFFFFFFFFFWKPHSPPVGGHTLAWWSWGRGELALCCKNLPSVVADVPGVVPAAPPAGATRWTSFILAVTPSIILARVWSSSVRTGSFPAAAPGVAVSLVAMKLSDWTRLHSLQQPIFLLGL